MVKTTNRPWASRLAILAIILLSTFLVGTNIPNAEADVYSLTKIPFPKGTYVIPMDEKQTDIIKAFGLAHALLRNSTGIFRSIQPPGVNLTTELYGTAVFEGGPFLIWRESASTVEQIKASFPNVTVDRLQQVSVVDNVLAIEEPTRILIIKGAYNWGETETLLENMSIPYNIIEKGILESNPSVLDEYNLVVDDCSGWEGNIQEEMISAILAYVEDGGKIVFTDKAILEATKIFPDHVTIARSLSGLFPSRVIQHADPPSQYWGPMEISIYTEGNGIVMKTASRDTKALLRSDSYGPYSRILAAYFEYGEGLVELFAYHPIEQNKTKTHSSSTYIFASSLYGNIFMSGKITLPTPLPPRPVPIAVPPPAAPPPPPPPPSIPTAVALPAGYLFAGAFPLGLMAVLKSKLGIKLKRKIAVTAK